jgi:hypothetical protein
MKGRKQPAILVTKRPPAHASSSGAWWVVAAFIALGFVLAWCGGVTP